MSFAINIAFLSTILLCCPYTFAAHENFCEKAAAHLCVRPYIPLGTKHVACDGTADGEYKSTCPTNAKELKMSNALKELIVQLHNKLRNGIATGRYPAYRKAAHMLEMYWSADLAYVAGFNARSCQMNHDLCRNTRDYRDSGQNLAIRMEKPQMTDVETHLEGMIGDWFSEHKYANESVIKSLPAKSSGPAYGHFTQMVQQYSGRIGCAVVAFEADTYFQTYMACNYATGNMVAAPVYDVGEPCTGCVEGCSKTWPGLCAAASGRLSGGCVFWLSLGVIAVGVLFVNGLER